MGGISFKHLVLDTSVVIKWFRQEEILARQALILRDTYLAGHTMISIPSLLIYELTNVLRYKNDLSTDQVNTAAQSCFDMGLEVVPPASSMIGQAVEIARTYDTTVYDAAFAALAQVLGATLVTADDRLVQQLSSFSFVRHLGDIQTKETDA